MNTSKLSKTLQALDAGEVKRLLQFLKSPFYNMNPAMVQLYLLLRSHYPAFDSPKLAKEKVFRKLFPDRPYDQKKMLNLMSDFTALLEKYLVQLQLEKEAIIAQKLLINAYAERPNSYSLFEQKTWGMDEELDAKPYRGAGYFLEKMHLNLQHFGHHTTSKFLDKKDSLNAAVLHFEAYKNITDLKLKCASNAMANTVGTNGELDQGSVKEVLSQVPAFILYEKLEQFQRTETGSNLSALVDYFIAHIDRLSSNDREYILKILLNYCIRQFNTGKQEFLSTSLDLYKTGLRHDCLLPNGEMTKNTFHNIVSCAVTCHEFDWAKDFMASFADKLDEEIREDTITISMAQWHFANGSFEATIQILQHSFKEPLDIFKSKSFLIRSWYELSLNGNNYFELMQTQLDALEKFTRRDKSLVPNMSKAYLKFVLYTQKLISKNWNEALMQALRGEIEQETNLAFKDWLLAKTSVA